MNKRNFIILVGIFIFGYYQNVFSYPISKYLGLNIDSNYTKLYFKKMYQLHCAKFFDFEKNWSKNEKKLLDSWILSLDSLGLKVNNTHFYENFRFSHQFKHGTVNSSEIMISLNQWNDDLLKIANKVISEKKIEYQTLNNKNFRGFGWNFKKNQFMIYTLIHEVDLTKDNNLEYLSKIKNTNWIYPILQKRVFDLKTKESFFEWEIPNKEITKESLSKTLPLDLTSVVQVIRSDEAKHEYIYRLRSLSNEAVDLPIHNIIKTLSDEFNAHPDYIKYIDKSDFTLYYP